MRNYFKILLLISTVFLSCSTGNINGTYISKYNEYDGISFQLDINCDGTAYFIRKYQTKKDTITAKWQRFKDTLVIKYDSVLYQSQPSEKSTYRITRKKLKYVAFSKASFKEASKKMKAEGYEDSLKLKKYAMFSDVHTYNKYINEIPIDFKNTWKNQFFIKQIENECQ